MENFSKLKKSTVVVTNRVRFCFVHIKEPWSYEETQKKKYCAHILIPKTDEETFGKINSAIDAARKLGLSKWGGKTPAGLVIPLRDGDEKDDDVFQGHWYINAKSDKQPQVFNYDGNELANLDELYSGSYGRAVIKFFPYDAGSKGIACGLSCLIKLEDGDRL